MFIQLVYRKRGRAVMSYYFDWWTPIDHIPDMLSAAGITIASSLVIFILEIVISAFLGYIRYNKTKVLYGIVTAYVEIIRNTPVLIQIYILFFGLPQLGIMINQYTAGFIALLLYGCAYTCEIYRAGIQSIDKGQWEAGGCVGLSKLQVFVSIIFPQAVRNIFPALINQFVNVMYATALLSAIDVREITGVTKIISGSTFRTFEMYTFAMILYYILSNVTTFILRKINRKYFPSISVTGE